MSMISTLLASVVLAPSQDYKIQNPFASGQISFEQKQPDPLGQNSQNQDPEKKEQDDPFDKAVKDHEMKEGVVDTYLKDNSMMFAIPESLLGRDFLWYSETKASSSGGFSGSSVGRSLVRFEKRGDSLLMRNISYANRGKGDPRMEAGVAMGNTNGIVAALPIKATKDGKHLVDMDSTFLRGYPEMRMGPANIDARRSFIDAVKTFPENVNVTTTVTTTGAGASTTSLHHSFVLLPEKPMKGRLGDSRVGYFDTGFTMYDGTEHGSKEYSFISRYRLEKKDPSAAVSEPVEPIVYYVAKEVPEKWRAAVHQGIEDWQVAFEAAGFENAIIAKDEPEDDPNFDAEDVRHSMVRWAPLPIANAIGPHVADPRSGEILSAHVIMWHDVLKLGAQWYFAQASPNDPRAQRIPFPDDLQAEIIRFVVAHEVGHTIGLHHNGESSAVVPTENLRSKEWTEANGTAASIMDYARFNYVAQPGDGARLMPKVGAYDKWAIKWGYTPLAGPDPWGDKAILDAWAAQQIANPLFRFYNNFSGVDPTAQAEALGDDAVVASTYGVANLKRVMNFLLPATTKFGEDYSDLATYHGAVFGQYNRYIGHVGSMIGGVVTHDYHAGRGGNVYQPVSKSRQKAAVKWLLDNGVNAQTWLIPKDIMMKIGIDSGKSRIDGVQNRVWFTLLNTGRMNRMMDNSLMNGANAYSVGEMFQDIHGFLWTDLSEKSITMDSYRMNAQRGFVNRLIDILPNSSSPIRAYSLAELKKIKSEIDGSMKNAKDVIVKQHLADLSLMITEALENPNGTPAAGGGGLTFPFGFEEENVDHDGCSLFLPSKLKK